jgi:hypothetical protein
VVLGSTNQFGSSFELGKLVDGGVSTKAALLDSIVQLLGVLLIGVEEITKTDVMLPQLAAHPKPFQNTMGIDCGLGARVEVKLWKSMMWQAGR